MAFLFVADIAYSDVTGMNASEEHVGIEISLTYQRGTTIASNQLAVWVENAEGTSIRTLMVTNFTAGRRGYRNRDMSLPAWVKAANPESLTDSEIDAMSYATPRPGQLAYIWDLTDDGGQTVPAGVYTIHVEGTLYWESDILYTAVIDTAHPVEHDFVEMKRTEPNNHENEDMITQVYISVVPY